MNKPRGSVLWEKAERAFDAIHVERLKPPLPKQPASCGELADWIRSNFTNDCDGQELSANRGNRICHLHGLGGSGKTRVLNELEKIARELGVITVRFELTKDDELKQSGIRWTKLAANQINQQITKYKKLENSGKTADLADLELLHSFIRHFSPAASVLSAEKPPRLLPTLVFLFAVALAGVSRQLFAEAMTQWAVLSMLAAIAGSIYPMWEFWRGWKQRISVQANKVKKGLRSIGLDLGDLPHVPSEDMTQWPDKVEEQFEELLAAALALMLLRISQRNGAPVLVLFDVEYLPARTESIEHSISSFFDSVFDWSEKWNPPQSQREWNQLFKDGHGEFSTIVYRPATVPKSDKFNAFIGGIISHKMMCPVSDFSHSRILVDPFGPSEQKALYEFFEQSLAEEYFEKVADQMHWVNRKLSGQKQDGENGVPWPVQNVLGIQQHEGVLPRDIKLATEAVLTLPAEYRNHPVDLRQHFRSVWHRRAVDRLFPHEFPHINIVKTLSQLPFFPSKLLDRFSSDLDVSKHLAWLDQVGVNEKFGTLYSVRKPIRSQLLIHRAHIGGDGSENIIEFIKDKLKDSSEQGKAILLCMAASTIATLLQGERTSQAKSALKKFHIQELESLLSSVSVGEQALIASAIITEIKQIPSRLQRDRRLGLINGKLSEELADELEKHCENLIESCASLDKPGLNPVFAAPSGEAIDIILNQYHAASSPERFWEAFQSREVPPPWKLWPRYSIEEEGDGLRYALKLFRELEKFEGNSIVTRKWLLKFRESLINRHEHDPKSDSLVQELKRDQFNSIKLLIEEMNIEEVIDPSFMKRVRRTSQDKEIDKDGSLFERLEAAVVTYVQENPVTSIQLAARFTKKITGSMSLLDLCLLMQEMLSNARRNETSLAWHFVLFEYAIAIFERFCAEGNALSVETAKQIYRCRKAYVETAPKSIPVPADSTPWERYIAWAIEQTHALFETWEEAAAPLGPSQFERLAKLVISSERVQKQGVIALVGEKLIRNGFNDSTATNNQLADLLQVLSCQFEPHGIAEHSDDGKPCEDVRIVSATSLLSTRDLVSVISKYADGSFKETDVAVGNAENILGLVEKFYGIAGTHIENDALLRWALYRLMHIVLVVFRILRFSESSSDKAAGLTRCIRLYSALAVSRYVVRRSMSFGIVSTSGIDVPSFPTEQAAEVLLTTSAREIGKVAFQMRVGKPKVGDILFLRCKSLNGEKGPEFQLFDSQGVRALKFDFFEGAEEGLLPPLLGGAWSQLQKKSGSPDKADKADWQEGEVGSEAGVSDSWVGGGFLATVRGVERTGDSTTLRMTARGALFLSEVLDAVLPMGIVGRRGPENSLSWEMFRSGSGWNREDSEELFVTGSLTNLIVLVQEICKGVVIGGDGAVIKAFERVCGIHRVALVSIPDVHARANQSETSLRERLDEAYVRSLLNDYISDLSLEELGNPTLFSSQSAGKKMTKERTFLALYRKFAGRSGVIVRPDQVETIRSQEIPQECWDPQLLG